MSSEATYTLQLLDPRRHDRRGFACGEESLDTYLRRFAGQDSDRRAAVVYVLTPDDQPDRITGYVTLANSTVALQAVPEAARKHLPRYPDVPATLVGRLAVNRAFQGQGLRVASCYARPSSWPARLPPRWPARPWWWTHCTSRRRPSTGATASSRWGTASACSSP